jgi:DNA polymerase III subunit gamma/tau
MSELDTKQAAATTAVRSTTDSKYTVVARRYRPKDFDELVGQATIVQALTTAIHTHRVGHAYLFTGARGVGKTSTARIFAKALNASADGSGKFDLTSDVAQAIDAGEDMDVLEIDGASNRGIDEIRQLRANVAVRPSRSPYKIYIIDEVHMLTGAAFNALLKTLEEPPAHVKFIFCTTDPEKIPITVLSRCQRFDFAPVKSDQILERLRFICQSEGATAEESALLLIARRAAGSMRDSQSLLEQILSFASGHIATETVHAILGTADESRLASIADSMIARDAAAVLQQLDQATNEGVDAGQLGEQLLGYLRDMMTIGVGGSVELLRTAAPARADELRQSAKSWGTMTLLSAIQLLDEALVKMRHSTQSRILLEVAVVQICHLQDLQGISDLLRALQSGKTPPVTVPQRVTATPSAVDEKKKVDVAGESELRQPQSQPAQLFSKQAPPNDAMLTNRSPSYGHVAHDDQLQTTLDEPRSDVSARAEERMHPETALNSALNVPSSNLSDSSDRVVLATSLKTSAHHHELQSDDLDLPNSETDASSTKAFAAPLETWRKSLELLEGYAADCASMVVRIDVQSGGDWNILFPLGCDFAIDVCNEPANRIAIEQALHQKLGKAIPFQFVASSLPPPRAPSNAARTSQLAAASQNTLIRKYLEHPLVKSLLQSIEGEIVRVDAAIRIAQPHVNVNDAVGESQPTSKLQPAEG